MSDREDFRRLVGDDEYRRLLRIAQSCDGNLDVMQELYHERIAGAADPDPEARAMRRVLSMQAERLRSLSSECDELRYEVGSGHAAKEALARLCEAVKPLYDGAQEGEQDNQFEELDALYKAYEEVSK